MGAFQGVSGGSKPKVFWDILPEWRFQRKEGPLREREIILQALLHHFIELRGHPSGLPKNALGRAIDYTLGLWGRLCVHLGNGHVEIDNNGIENAIRPIAIGRKNWLFIREVKTPASAAP